MGRFGLSFLSKKKAKDAWTEELLVHKHTGEVLIKTPDNDVVSYNFNSRRQQHINDVEARAKVYGIAGMIYELDISDTIYQLPDAIPANTNIIADNPVIQGKIGRFLLSVDVDSYLYNAHALSTSYLDSNVGFTITLRSRGLDVAYINKSMKASELANTVFKTSDFTDQAVDEIQLSGLLFTSDGTSTAVRTVLNSVLIVVDE